MPASTSALWHQVREVQLEHPAWQTLIREQLVDVHPWLRLWREVVKLPDGRVVDDYYTLDMPDFVVVTAFTRGDQIVAERHYKHGVRRVVLALPAGHLEANEEPISAAQRELLEETGYGGGMWHALGTFAVSGTRGCGQAHFFLAREVEWVAEPTSDDLEQTEVLLVTPDQFLRAIYEEEVGDLPMVSAFMLAYTTQRSLLVSGRCEQTG